MIKIDKTYTIKFSYAGILQYARFFEKDGKLVNPKFTVQYCKVDEVPSVEGLEIIEEVLTVIKTISYGGRASIYLINGHPVNYFYNTHVQDIIKESDKIYEEFISKAVISFFEEVLEPILKLNKWYVGSSHIGHLVVIHKDETDEWDNIPHDEVEFDFDYICCMFVTKITPCKTNLTSESNEAYSDGASKLLQLLPFNYLKEKGYYIET